MTRVERATAATLAIAALLALVASGCGSSSSSSSSATESSETSENAGAEFLVPGNKEVDKIIEAGKESSPAEREAASEALEEMMEARAAHDWSAQCETLTAELVKSIEESGSKIEKKASCAKKLGELGEEASPGTLENTMDGPIDALRVVNSQGFAFYHGKENKDYLIPMGKEGPNWKVASLVPEEITSGEAKPPAPGQGQPQPAGSAPPQTAQ